MARKLPNVHPGEVLAEEFLAPLELGQHALARALAVPPRRINEIVLGKRAVMAGKTYARATQIDDIQSLQHSP